MSAAKPQPLALSLFPGGGLADYAFEQEGYCVVRGPDVIWGGDIRSFHPPAGVFWGVYGGDPCQSHSSLANLVRAKGLEPSFPDMTPEFQRVVEEAQPAWFLRENVPKAPDIQPAGYSVRSFLLCNSTLDSGDGTGNEQMRRRRFWFGVREGECPELRAFMDFALFELLDAAPAVRGSPSWQYPDSSGLDASTPGSAITRKRRQQAVAGDAPSVPVAMGGSGKRKVTAVSGNDGTADAIGGYRKARDAGKDYSPPRRTLADMLELQGMPADWLDHQPWTMSAKRKIVGNGWSVPMGRQLARAIREAMGE
jgi:DNA (cytosine-5)-methyltransferase 1